MSAFLLTAGLVAEATGGTLASGSVDRVFDRVVTDSRTMAPALTAPGAAGALFVALSGPNFDGHDFVPQAAALGAAGVLVSRVPADTGGAAVILVDDVLAALQRLGHQVRVRSGARVVAITGSAGKTTTKEATAALLSGTFTVFRNAGNLNNHIGLPLSLLELRHGPDIAVLELGMNHAGEIRALTRIAAPDVRVWTNVGNAHIGHFGSREAIARAKAEILEDAGPSTLVIANADDPLVMRHVGGTAARVLTFGVTRPADVRVTQVRDRGFDGTEADVETPAGPLALRLALPGLGNLSNVLAAVTVAVAHDVPAADIHARAAALRPVDKRGAAFVLRDGARLIDDSYNASPAALQVTLETLAATAVTGRRIAVLGEMLELGDAAVRLHEECGEAAARAGVDWLVVVGGAAADGLQTGAERAGLPAARIRRCATSRDAADVVAALIGPGDLVVVKGSRGTRMEVIADRLRAEA